jgi:hypothetical protein
MLLVLVKLSIPPPPFHLEHLLNCLLQRNVQSISISSADPTTNGAASKIDKNAVDLAQLHASTHNVNKSGIVKALNTHIYDEVLHARNRNCLLGGAWLATAERSKNAHVARCRALN